MSDQETQATTANPTSSRAVPRRYAHDAREPASTGGDWVTRFGMWRIPDGPRGRWRLVVVEGAATSGSAPTDGSRWRRRGFGPGPASCWTASAGPSGPPLAGGPRPSH